MRNEGDMSVHSTGSNDFEQEHFARVAEDLLPGAEKEMAAFVTAVDNLFGCEPARQAVEYWMEQLMRGDWSCDEISPNWRHLTITASARLADSVVVGRSVSEVHE
jgi:hypothetical protein